MKELLILNHHHGLSLSQTYYIYIYGAFTTLQRPSFWHLSNTSGQARIGGLHERFILRISFVFKWIGLMAN